VVGGQTVIVSLGLTRDGEKAPLGLRLGSTENAIVCTELLQDLLGRGLRVADRVLCVIDGGKGLRRALQDVLGTAAVIQRCQLHKARNLLALVPKARQAYVRAMLRRAYRAPSATAARRLLHALGTWLEGNGPARPAPARRRVLAPSVAIPRHKDLAVASAHPEGSMIQRGRCVAHDSRDHSKSWGAI
jgi:transposase-like protein